MQLGVYKVILTFIQEFLSGFDNFIFKIAKKKNKKQLSKVKNSKFKVISKIT